MNILKNENLRQFFNQIAPNNYLVYQLIMEVELAFGRHLQTNTSIRNLAVVMPDANMDATLNALVAAGFGSGGQKCAAISIVVFVGSFSTW